MVNPFTALVLLHHHFSARKSALEAELKWPVVAETCLMLY